MEFACDNKGHGKAKRCEIVKEDFRREFGKDRDERVLQLKSKEDKKK